MIYLVPKLFGMFIKSTNEIILISHSANYYPIVIWSPNPISSKIKWMLEELLLVLIKYQHDVCSKYRDFPNHDILEHMRWLLKSPERQQ